MVVKFNFTGVGTEGFDPWPEEEGIPFTIAKIEMKDSKSSGQPMVVFEFKHETSNRKAWRNFSLQAQALWGLKQFLIEIGVGEEELEEEFDFEPDEFIGTEVDLYFSPPRDWNGKSVQDIVGVSTR